MRWTDIADWIGPTPNESPGAMATVVGVVVHIQQGTEAGTEAWQRNPASQVSSHFLSPKTGRGRQMVDTADKAWCQMAGNSNWLSIENEGLSGQTLTPDQVEFNAQVLAKAHMVYGVPLQVTNDVSVPGLGHHSMGGVAWGDHPDCPGNPIIAQKPAIVVRAQQIVETLMAGEYSPDTARAIAVGATQAGYISALPPGWDDDLATYNLKAVEERLTKLINDVLSKVSTPTPFGNKFTVTVDSVT